MTKAETGRGGRDTNPAMRDLWRIADELNAARSADQCARGEMWVPWRAVAIHSDILPRMQQEPDGDTVDHYATIFEQLPAIDVQRDSLVLIDGLHRLSAAPQAGRDHIRVIERECTDDQLRLLAFLANKEHGRPLTATERTRMARWLLGTYPDGASGWSISKIADTCGVSRFTIQKWLQPSQSHTKSVEITHSDNGVIKSPAAPVSAPTFSARPSPPSPPPKTPARSAEDDDLSMAYAYAQILFGNYRAAELAQSVPADRVAEQLATVREWRRWCDEYEAALRRVGTGAE